MHSFGLTIQLSVLLLEGKRGGRQQLLAEASFSRVANISAVGTVIVTVVVGGDGVRVAII